MISSFFLVRVSLFLKVEVVQSINVHQNNDFWEDRQLAIEDVDFSIRMFLVFHVLNPLGADQIGLRVGLHNSFNILIFYTPVAAEFPPLAKRNIWPLATLFCIVKFLEL